MLWPPAASTEFLHCGRWQGFLPGVELEGFLGSLKMPKRHESRALKGLRFSAWSLSEDSVSC